MRRVRTRPGPEPGTASAKTKPLRRSRRLEGMAARPDAARRELLTQAQQRCVLWLRLEHDVEAQAAPGPAQEPFEGDGVDHVGVRPELRKHEAPPVLPAALRDPLFDGRPR